MQFAQWGVGFEAMGPPRRMMAEVGTWGRVIHLEGNCDIKGIGGTSLCRSSACHGWRHGARSQQSQEKDWETPPLALMNPSELVATGLT